MRYLVVLSMFFMIFGCSEQSEPDNVSNDSNALNFVAGGNRPGWKIVINENKIDITRNFGQDEETFDLSEDRSDTENIMLFDIENAEIDIFVEIEKTKCIDTRTSKEFEYKVTLHYDDEVLDGCGFVDEE